MSHEPYELDDEFVMQMEDSPPFQWLISYTERFISCSTRTKEGRPEIHSVGNPFTISRIFTDTFLNKSFDTSLKLFGVFITVSGENQEIISKMKDYLGEAIVISQGGNAKRIAREKGFDFYSLPRGIPSRFLFPEILGCLASIFSIKISLDKLKRTIQSLTPSTPTENNISKILAYAISRDFIISVNRNLIGVGRRIQDMMLQTVNRVQNIYWDDQLELFLRDSKRNGKIIITESSIVIEDPLNQLSYKLQDLDLISVLTIIDFAINYYAIISKKDISFLDAFKD